MRRFALAASLAGVFVVLGGMPVKAWPDEKDGPAPHGHGTGLGMMDDDGDNGMGPGMMGSDAGYGMGSGMMGSDAGYGVGRGMMGGDATYGMGPGMMSGYGMGPIWMLDLSDPQRAKVNAIGDQLRKTHWAIMGRSWTSRRSCATSTPRPSPIRRQSEQSTPASAGCDKGWSRRTSRRQTRPATCSPRSSARRMTPGGAMAAGTGLGTTAGWAMEWLDPTSDCRK